MNKNDAPLLMLATNPAKSFCDQVVGNPLTSYA